MNATSINDKAIEIQKNDLTIKCFTLKQLALRWKKCEDDIAYEMSNHGLKSYAVLPGKEYYLNNDWSNNKAFTCLDYAEINHIQNFDRISGTYYRNIVAKYTFKQICIYTESSNKLIGDLIELATIEGSDLFFKEGDIIRYERKGHQNVSDNTIKSIYISELSALANSKEINEFDGSSQETGKAELNWKRFAGILAYYTMKQKPNIFFTTSGSPAINQLADELVEFIKSNNLKETEPKKQITEYGLGKTTLSNKIKESLKQLFEEI